MEKKKDKGHRRDKLEGVPVYATMTGLGPSTSSSGIFPPFSVYFLHTPRLFTHFPVVG
jgi:hypothetical protein